MSGEERELKFARADLDEIRRRLVELGGRRLREESHERNWVFDRALPDRNEDELRPRQRLLRLRRDGSGTTLTYKGAPRFEGGTKIREEREVRLEETETMLVLLERLGYRVVRRYEKYREEWEADGVVVALDRTPMGDFVEFEGEGAARLAQRCGFDAERAERGNYLQLYEAYRESHPDAPADMVFS